MRTWLFHPFSRWAGVVSLIIGVAVIVTTAMIGWGWHGVATDGVLELHFVATNDFFSYLVLGGIAWLTLSLCLLVVGHGLTSTQYRIVDLLGTQALADDVLLADRLAEAPLTWQHGAPLRLVAPAHYGFRSAKQLQRIEFCKTLQHYRSPTTHWTEHPRARVAFEERGRVLPAGVYRYLYRAAIPLVRG